MQQREGLRLLLLRFHRGASNTGQLGLDEGLHPLRAEGARLRNSCTLETKARIATDLFEKGAARVKITDTDIDVTWREYEAATGQVSQAMQVNVSTSASAVASVSNSIRQIIRELDQLGIHAAKAPEAEGRLKTLEEELRKQKPRWDVIKQVLHWALDFSKELSLRLAVLMAEHYVASKL